MLKQRVITAIILAVLFLAALFKLPASGWYILLGLVVAQGSKEWGKLSKMTRLPALSYVCAMLFSFAALLWMFLNCLPQQKVLLQLSLYGISATFWLLVVPVWLKGIWNTKNKWLLALVGWIVLLPTVMAMMDLRDASPQPWWLLGVMGMVWMADIAAYFSGRKFGKHKLAPSVSPGKTWEGVAGAILGVLIYVIVVMQISGLEQYYSLLLLALLAVPLSVVGDLFESAIKRQSGVKDSGNLLPGHGGLLDRIDALTSTLPMAAILLAVIKLP